MQVTLKLENIESVKKKLENIEDNITNTAPLMSEISNHLYNMSKDSFDDEKDPRGHTWTPLSELTKKYKSTSKILYKDGDMQRGLISESDSDSAIVGITTVNEDDYFYPIVHQFGANNAGRNKKLTIPARPFFPINSDESLYEGVENILMEITVEFIESGLK